VTTTRPGGTPISLVLRDGPPILALERLTVGGAVLRLNDTLTNGRWVVADLQHPDFGAAPLSTAARVSWSQQIAPGLPLSLAGLEFTGSWEALGTLRRAILGVVASKALAADAPVGFVTVEPDGSWTCHTAQTIKVAMISADGAAFSVRRRDDRDPGGVVLAAASFAEALARAFDLDEAPRLDPQVGPASGPRSGAIQKPMAVPKPKAPAAAVTPPAPPKRTGAAAAYEEAVLAARTVVIAPERPPAMSEASEAEILGANTMVVGPERPMSESTEDAILASRTIIEDDRPPSDDPESTAVIVKKGAAAEQAPRRTRSDPPTRNNRRWSKVLSGGKQVGWIAPDTPTAWSTYDDAGRKTAVISAEEGVVRVCWLGDQATESFEYFEAPTAKEAIVVAFELTAEPKIEPPLAGLF
jgi:hypothetical protein